VKTPLFYRGALHWKNRVLSSRTSELAALEPFAVPIVNARGNGLGTACRVLYFHSAGPIFQLFHIRADDVAKAPIVGVLTRNSRL